MATPHPTVILTRPLPGDFALRDTKQARLVVGPEQGHATRAELLDAIKGASAVVTWWTDSVNEEFLDGAGPALKVVCNFAVGHENIDHELCAQRGVVACNTPDAVTEGTADVAWALLMNAARRMTEGDRYARSGEWAKRGPLGPRDFMGQPIAGQTLLIVGAGRIGYATALRSIGWGMRILYTARTPKPLFEMAPLNAQRVTLEQGLREADFVSVHTPLTDDTHHLIGARELSLMKPTSVIVNTARGPVIDEDALAKALRERTIFGAGLDVFEREPEVHPELKDSDHVSMTPHFGSADTRCRSRMTDLCAANIDAVLSGNPALTPIT